MALTGTSEGRRAAWLLVFGRDARWPLLYDDGSALVPDTSPGWRQYSLRDNWRWLFLVS